MPQAARGDRCQVVQGHMGASLGQGADPGGPQQGLEGAWAGAVSDQPAGQRNFAWPGWVASTRSTAARFR